MGQCLKTSIKEFLRGVYHYYNADFNDPYILTNKNKKFFDAVKYISEQNAETKKVE